MKRMTDDLENLLALDNLAMETYLESASKMGKGREKNAFKMIVSAVQKRTTLDISDLINVAGDTEIMNVAFKNIDGAIPPWDVTFVEWEATPGAEWSKMAQMWCEFPVRRYGVLVIGIPINDMANLLATPEHAMGWDRSQMKKYSPDEIRDILLEEHPIFRELPEGEIYRAKWYLMMFPFVRSDKRIIGPFFETHLVLDEEGKLLTMPITDDNQGKIQAMSEDGTPASKGVLVWNEWAYSSPKMRKKMERDPEYAKMAVQSAMGFSHFLLIPPLVAFQFANYSNITPREITPRYESRQVRKAAERRGEPPLQRYHVLEIGPAGVKDPSRFRPLSEVMRDVPLHDVRRHLAHYGPKYGRGLLFGKYEGKFWIPPHVRGKKSNRVVAKDYKETGKLVGVGR